MYLFVPLPINQCDQIGQFFALWATIQSRWQNLFYPNQPTLLGNFCKGVKVIHFLMKSFWVTFIKNWRILSGHAAFNSNEIFERFFRDPEIKFQLLFVLAIAIGHFLDGAVLAYPAPAIPSINNTTEFDFDQMPFVRESILSLQIDFYLGQ